MRTGPAEAFTEAAGWFADLVDRVDGDWDAQALGVWSRLDLVGHTTRSLLTVESYLRESPGPEEALSAVDYYVTVRASLADAEAVAERGRQAGAALRPDPQTAVRAITDRVLALVAGAGIDAYVQAPVGDLWLADYLSTRAVELVVHGCDLAVACGLDARPPAGAAAEAGAVLVGLAAEGGVAADLLLALTGRRGLPDGFTVL